MTSKNLPTAHPAEILQISPESLEVANCYLTLQNIPKVAEELGISNDMVAQLLARREVKAYIDNVFFDMGFNNRFKMRAAMDALLEKKFQEMDEAGVGSSKDIAELMALSHKMYMEQINADLALEKARGHSGPKSQVNVQINEGGGGSNYHNLLDRIINNVQ